MTMLQQGVYVHTGGGTWQQMIEDGFRVYDGSWRNIQVGYVHTGGGTWEKFWEVGTDPTFGTCVFRSGLDTDENGESNENTCDCVAPGPKYYNEWCWQWNVNDCVGGVHQLQCYRDTGGGMISHGNLFNCTGGTFGWCTKAGYSGAMLSGANGTSACGSEAGDDFEFTLEPNGGGSAYDTIPPVTPYTLAQCTAA